MPLFWAADWVDRCPSDVTRSGWQQQPAGAQPGEELHQQVGDWAAEIGAVGALNCVSRWAGGRQAWGRGGGRGTAQT